MIYLPPWLRLAQQEAQMGHEEIRGSDHNPVIVNYGTAVTLEVTSDEVPWCSNFINWLFFQLDMPRTGSARARSWLAWGIPLDSPALGCVVIIKRGSPHEPGPEVLDARGHVFLLTDMMEPGTVTGIGGNQSNKVCERTYPKDRVLGYRWPG